MITWKFIEKVEIKKYKYVFKCNINGNSFLTKKTNRFYF